MHTTCIVRDMRDGGMTAPEFLRSRYSCRESLFAIHQHKEWPEKSEGWGGYIFGHTGTLAIGKLLAVWLFSDLNIFCLRECYGC